MNVRGTLCLAAIVAIAAAVSGQSGEVTVFENARVIVGDGSAPIVNAALLVQNDRIVSVGSRRELKVPAGAARVDLTGKTVMPAIVDLHTHLGYVNYRTPAPVPEEFTRENLVDHLKRYACYGAAAVVSLGADPGDLPFQVRDETIPGAAVFRTAGPGIATPNSGPSAEARKNVPYTINTEEDARKAVRELAGRKVDFVKIWVDDRGGKAVKMPPALYGAVIDEAHKHNLRVVAHIFALDDAKGLLKAGVDGFAHGIRDRDVDDEVIALFKQRRQVFVIPNLPDRGVAEDPAWLGNVISGERIELMRQATAALTSDAVQKLRDTFGIQARNLVRLAREGVKLGLGTDGDGGGWNAHVEMADMVAAGLTPAQVIVAATRNSAEILRLTQLGTLAAGKSADFMVLDANPLDDITNTRRIAKVYLRGEEVGCRR
jgi:imidazolonepropionase-like amidohydrolase